MEKDKIIQQLLEEKLLWEEIRYDVSVWLPYQVDTMEKRLKELGVTKEELRDYIQDYANKRKIFFFARLNKPFDEVEFKIGAEVIKPNPRQ